MVVGVARWSRERRFEDRSCAQQLCRAGGSAVDDRGVELERVLEGEVGELEVVLGTRGF